MSEENFIEDDFTEDEFENEDEYQRILREQEED
jgi:hypothetical protein